MWYDTYQWKKLCNKTTRPRCMTEFMNLPGCMSVDVCCLASLQSQSQSLVTVSIKSSIVISIWNDPLFISSNSRVFTEWKPCVVFRAMSGSITAGILPAGSFMNGHTYFAQRLATQMSLEPFAVHVNWIKGTPAKLFHLRESNLWLVSSRNPSLLL